VSERTRGKPPAPQVQVIRRPATGPVTPTPSTLRPTVTATPRPLPVTPSPTVMSPSVAPARPASGATAPRGPFRGPARSSVPRGPVTPESIAALARKERVPNRIAKGELDGKMKCRVWKKLHAEEAKRFDQAWNLMEVTPGLELADAFGIVQSGMSVEEFRARRARAKRREAIKEARATVAREAIDGFIEALITDKSELAFVMGERTTIDVLTGVAAVAFTAERGGQLEKLHLVLLTRKATWEALLPNVVRDPKLSQKPASVARQPARRPVSDPRGFLPHVGTSITVSLRNGIKLSLPLLAVGPFDVLLGSKDHELFVPLHAMLTWEPT
jgi:hypothetical protein